MLAGQSTGCLAGGIAKLLFSNQESDTTARPAQLELFRRVLYYARYPFDDKRADITIDSTMGGRIWRARFFFFFMCAVVATVLSGAGAFNINNTNTAAVYGSMRYIMWFSD